jgi:Protein of unknown function (DUF726)
MMNAKQQAIDEEKASLGDKDATAAVVPAQYEGGEEEAGVDEFGLPRRPLSRRLSEPAEDETDDDGDTFHDVEDLDNNALEDEEKPGVQEVRHLKEVQILGVPSDSPQNESAVPQTSLGDSAPAAKHESGALPAEASVLETVATPGPGAIQATNSCTNLPNGNEQAESPSPKAVEDNVAPPQKKRGNANNAPAVSEWSHQRLASKANESDDEEEDNWQAMPALGEYDIYDDEDRLVAKANRIHEDGYEGIGGAGKGYTRVQLDEDAQSATSMDENTNYLFKEGQTTALVGEEQRDAVTQLEATKDLLTEAQRIAYVGVTRLTIYNMVKELAEIEKTKGVKKELVKALESMEKWGQQMMVRLYGHMDINSAEQIMIEQLAEHDVQPLDLVPPLMHSSRVKNPMANGSTSGQSKPPPYVDNDAKKRDEISDLPLQEATNGEEVPEIQSHEEMPQTENIELDLRWTVLCDLFLVLISDGVYDARSRLLLERVASVMDISWIQICRFEKRVMDALEMQEASRENWNEEEHLENRRKMGLKRKYLVMGLATVGGGLVIGLSAGLLAPVIGAGLAAGFTTIGVTGTAGFLGGVGGAALITSAATAAGGTIAVRASHRRTGHVKTFEYRPLHNNKRLNLILTASGWMNGKIDDVRLPYSTVDPIMGDIYSLLWEPEMLQSMGDTINILATEALTQTVQQVLGSTILVALMASIQLPVVLTKLSYLIDNPWTVSLDRANSAGQILADSLIDRHLGQRPITLVGFSLGSRLIFACLKELAARGAHGLVQNAYLFGSPVVAKRDEYLRARSVISGRFVNGYASNDWILGYLFRATSGGIMRVAGLAPVEGIPGLENIDVTTLVNGHMAYRTAMPKLLREVGWEVESDEFTEIEDPDPENHQQRQRELIQEIDDARKKAEEKPEKKRFGFFKRGKLAEKKGWETYDTNKLGHSRSGSDGQATPGLEANVLFDIDAIRRELESEMIEVRELDSTLPPMQITTLVDGGKVVQVQLPPDLHPDEIAAMKLPPRPDEIEDGHVPRPAFTRISRSITSEHAPEPDYGFAAPRELQTTLPPLTLTPSLPPESLTTPFRPDLRSHSSTPAASSWNVLPGKLTNNIASPIAGMSLHHNAWADDDDYFGQETEMKMTFE